jgi:N-acetylglucosaminyl-diphospho-decaprenol L-rhamnosyltransferase
MAALRPTSAPRLGVVTVSYGSDDVLRGLLATIPDAAREPVAVVVADNLPSTGGAAGIAAEFGAEYLPLPENPGYGGAVNAGAARLPQSVDWLLVVNPDAALGPDSIATLVTRGESEESIGAVGPLVRNADGSVYPSARAVPSLRTGVGHAMLGPLWPGNPWTRAYRNDAADTPRVRDAGWLSGSCVLVRRSAFDQIGGFDEGYFMYFEDVDLGVRLAQAGYRNVYEPAAEVVHTGAHSTGQASERMIRAHHESARRFLHSKYPGALLAPVRWVLAVGLRIRSQTLIARSRRM